MRKCIALAILILMLASSASLAHEYWIEPGKFFLTPKESSPVRLFLGEGLKVEEERPFQSSKTSLFRMVSSSAQFDLVPTIREEAAPLFSFSADKPGTYLLAMERNWSYITLEADKFDAYLREDGMEYIIAEREKLGEAKKEAKERYSRYLKSFIQVGDRRDKTFAKRVNLRFEIMPLANPYSLSVGKEMQVQVMFEGKPLAGKTLFADNRDGEAISKQRLVTDNDGKATVKIDRKGVWLVRLVFMQRCTKNCEGADWESFWGALSFGVR